MKRALRIGLWVAATLLSPLLLLNSAHAHEMSMGEMELREARPGDFLWQWSASNDKQCTISEDLTPQWPESCVAEQNLLRCGSDGLKGKLAITGVGKTYSAVLVKVFWLDGQARVYTLTAGQPSVQLYGAADDPRGRGEIAKAYVILGVEHILSGIDHLLFVFGLLFLVGFQRKLVWTITAFTVAHSLTLASAALGWLTLRSPPVEATIALSIVLVAGEALHQRMSLARRWPVVLAFLFGLVHGLGFAGALKEIGLPENYLPTALLCFNVGVEIGQLITVAAAWLIYRMLVRWPQAQLARTPLLYTIGSVAAYWSWLRVAAIFG
ncbi:MAG TPA: HupE/UreJ family protein [Spongiibacteraceae bacterium]|nr:HupE/UreJ family protein [Spongiibacteraceae bacterium]